VFGQKDSAQILYNNTTSIPFISAEFPGGKDKLFKYIKTNVTDKVSISKDAPVVEKVIAKFTVDQNGNVTNATIHKSSGHSSIDKLLLDAIIAMPKWTPAQNPKDNSVGQEMLFPLFICGR
jgi:TonB family protein